MRTFEILAGLFEYFFEQCAASNVVALDLFHLGSVGLNL